MLTFSPKVVQAERDGFDAVIIYCGDDPAVGAARELVDIPVIGPGKVAKMIALDLSYRFSILTVLKAASRAIWRKPIERASI